jgi:UDPglucose--hexose-1-phosphate uridylyltransferase
MAATGTHEVFITPHHDRGYGGLSLDEAYALLSAYRDRYLEHAANESHKYILIMTNYGREAGASVDHPHSQLLCIPVVPALVSTELMGAADHLRRTQRCVFCEMVEHELAEETRIVAETRNFTVFCPYASRSPFETWIVPKGHSAYFERLKDAELRELSEVLVDFLSRLSEGLGDPAYNFYLHTSPVNDGVRAFYHWHIEILPRLAVPAGFELGTGVMINVTKPEDAAAFLRDVP